MIVWGGILTPANTCYNTGARYNPVTDTWTPLAPQNVPEARMFWRPDLALWTGSGMLFYGGSVYPQEISSTALYVPDNLDGRPVISTQPRDVVALEGHSATFSVAAYGTEPFSFQWWIPPPLHPPPPGGAGEGEPEASDTKKLPAFNENPLVDDLAV